MKSVRLERRSAEIAPEIQAAAIPNALQRVYANRGVVSLDAISLPLNQLLPPTQLKGAREAAELLAEAIECQASVVIVGDFDADHRVAVRTPRDTAHDPNQRPDHGLRSAVFGLPCHILGACDHAVDFRGRDRDIGCRHEYSRSRSGKAQRPRADVGISWHV